MACVWLHATEKTPQLEAFSDGLQCGYRCPFCGPPLPDNATRWMRKGYYLAVTWIDYLAGQVTILTQSPPDPHLIIT